jgi:aminopeptidase N
MYARPALWYNGYDGVKVGANLNGNYMNYKHIFDLTIWLNTGLGQSFLPYRASVNSHDPMSFLLTYKTATDKFMKKSGISINLRYLDGLAAGAINFERRSNNDKWRLYMQIKDMERFDTNTLNYLIYRGEWSSVKRMNSSASAGADFNYSYRRGVGFINLHMRAPFLGDYNYSYMSATAINKTYFGKIGLHTRFFVQYGIGTNVPKESMLYAAGANLEDMMDSKYTRSMGIFQPFSFGANTTNVNFAAGGGLNLRGYMGYLLPSLDSKGALHYNYQGTSGAAINAELDFSRLFNFIPKATKQTVAFGTYLFGDAGVMNTNSPSDALALSSVMVDAGVGTTLTIQRWWKLQELKPLTIRADFPLFINHLPYAESNYFSFRCMIGISRAF